MRFIFNRSCTRFLSESVVFEDVIFNNQKIVLNTDFVNSDEKTVLNDKQSHEHDSDVIAGMPR